MSHGCPPGALSLHPLGSWDAVIRPPDPALAKSRGGGMGSASTDHGPGWNFRQLGLGQETDGRQLGGHPGFRAPRVTCHTHPRASVGCRQAEQRTTLSGEVGGGWFQGVPLLAPHPMAGSVQRDLAVL